MPPKAHILHSMPGRTRVRIPERRGDHGYFQRVVSQLDAIEGIRAVNANPVTGSVLIHHDALIDPLAQRLMELRLFQIIPPEAEQLDPNLSYRVAQKLEEADNKIRRATAGRMDLNAAMIVSLVTAGVFQILRGDVLPAGGTLLWYAFGLAWLRPKKAPIRPI